jgi:hypothetical protein
LPAAISSAQVFAALFAGLFFFNTPAHSEVAVCSEAATCQWGTMKGEPPHPDRLTQCDGPTEVACLCLAAEQAAWEQQPLTPL